MKTRMKAFGAVGATAVLALGLGGCAADGGGATESLVWWATPVSGSLTDDEAVWAESAQRYTDETGIEVELEVIPWADLYNRILTAVSSGSGPDVLNIGTTWTASLQDTGAFSPATGDNLEAMGGSDRFIPAAWEAAAVPGSDQVAVPLLSSVYSLYYNTALFEAAGLTEPPSDWAEFVEYGKRLTLDLDGDGTTDQWGYTNAAAAGTINSHAAFIFGAQSGGSFVDEEGQATLSSPGQVEGVTRYVDLMAADGIQSPSDAELDLGADAVDRLIGGQAAMTFAQNPLEQFATRGFEDWAIAPIPVIAGGENVQTMLSGINVLVFDESPHTEAAFELVGHLTSPEEQAFLANEFLVLPTVTEAYDLAPLADNGDVTLDVRLEILADASAPFPLVPDIGEIEKAAGDSLRLMFQAYATGSAPDVEGRLIAADEQLR